MLKKFLVGLLTLVASIGMAFAAVNINTASQTELEGLSGIGPAKAKAIIDYRKAHGDFKTVDDLKEVKGIGAKTLEKLRPNLAVTGETTPPAAAKPAKAEKPAAASAPADQSAPKADKKGKK